MKIAIPSNDGNLISPHFGRSLGFRIINIDNGNISTDNFIKNDFTGHAQGHHEHQGQEHHHQQQHQQHSHQGIFNALDGVDSVIAGGMGRRLYDEFVQRNIKVFVTQQTNIEDAVKLFIENKLDNQPGTCCSH